MAAVAVGQLDPMANPNPPPTYPRFAAGHAPGAQIVSISISNAGAPRWPTNLDTVLNAVSLLEDRMLQGDIVHVLNISYDLWPDPQHPSALALDLLERELDVLVVASASNEGDATSASAGFVNGLIVGNVHKWGANPLTARYPHRWSSRGPLYGDHDRYFPDVCATGAGVGLSLLPPHVQMPMVDDQFMPNPTNSCRLIGLGFEWYDGAGTSVASPQVAGAATLYRAERPSASALETKAAILLTTVDPFQHSNTTFAPRHTYSDRNATGVGYLRDDILARYALRNALDNPLGTQVTLTASTPTASVIYGGLTAGVHYAVAIAWPRQFEPDFDPAIGESVDWPNVDLTVRTSGDNPQVIARSDSLRSTYEHLVFTASGSAAEIVVAATAPHANGTPVFIAARKVTPINVTVQSSSVAVTSRRSIPGFVAELAQPGSCSHVVPDQTVTRTLPSGYNEAYGSWPFAANPTGSGDPFSGLYIGRHGVSGNGGILENIYSSADIPATSPFTVRAIALRSWAPFEGCTGTLGIEAIWMYSKTQGLSTLETLMYKSATPTSPQAIPVAANLAIPLHDPVWSARGYRTWPIIIPFSTPFTVDPSKALGIWIKFAPGSPCGTAEPEVDAVSDGTSFADRYAMYQSPLFVGGNAAIIGLIEGATASRAPRLEAYGFPRESETLLFQVRHGPPSGSVVLQLGYSNPNLLVGSCLALASSDLVASLPLTTSSMGDASTPFSIPAGLVHQHVFAQASFLVGGTPDTLRTNGVRLTIGGLAP